MRPRKQEENASTTSAKKCADNVTELTKFLKSSPTINRLSEKSKSNGVTSEQLISESELFEVEGDKLERSTGERALALACFTKAASLSKAVSELESISPDVQLRAQIRRESCLKKARNIYRKMLVESVQNPQHPITKKSKKTKQVYSEKRSCTRCSKMVFWLKCGLCSDCDLLSRDEKRAKVNRVETKHIRDFTIPKQAQQNKIPEESFVSPKSCALCSANSKTKKK
ncbi:uncharacterized protein LOC134824280 [Bolinopsis microptera]|uniref:uncharacterized protein LOC134824280 n=1 Tax=Bolinopsis microptera TaxID=2820187 RepID=UPI003079F3FA